MSKFENKEFSGFTGDDWRLLKSDEKFQEGDEHIGWGGYEEGWLPIENGLLELTLDDVMFIFARRVKDKP
jgi:hypothetical protein